MTTKVAAFLLLVHILLGGIEAELCPGGKEVFMLATNARMDTEVYSSFNGGNLTDCVETCRDDIRCRSLTFIKNTTDTHCQLMEVSMLYSHVIHERMLSPANGVYYFEKICLKGACDRLFVVEWIQGMELEGHDNKILTNLTKQGCLEACTTETSFVCRSAEYDTSSLECRLSRYDRFSRHIHFQKAKSSVSYYDNTCAYKPVNGGHTAEILLLGNVEHPYSLIEYRGLSVSECGEMCLRNSMFPCRSFLYGRQADSSYCGLTHQNRAGLLQNPGSFEPSHSLNYYEIARNLESCDNEDIRFELVSGKYMAGRPYKQIAPTAPHECLNRCAEDAKCRSLSMDYRRKQCMLHTSTLRAGIETNLKSDPGFNYFEKVCISTGNECNRHWAFERVPGKELVIPGHEKYIIEANTKEECQAACLASKEFVCRSAEFNYQMSECRLSPHSRFTLSPSEAKLEDSRFIVDYFENNCISEARGFCNTKRYRDQEMILSDLTIGTASQEDCQQRCFNSIDFICRSYSFEKDTQTCYLSHHTRRSAPDGAVMRLQGTNLIELNACFDVSVDCEPNMMKAKVRSSMFFKGKVYTRGKPMTCSLDVSNSLEFTLPIMLSGPECGTLNKEEGHFSNVLVIQSNDQVVTAMDKAVGVSCSYDVGNKTEDTAVEVGGPKRTDESRARPKLPDLSLHIMDMRGNERDTVSLGELLKVQVRMSEEDTYGIFVKNLVAKDGMGSTNLTLIDNTGCPVEAKMMREIRTIDTHSKSLESYLEAFAFTGSSMLELEAEVVTCRESCKPVLCQIPTGRREDDIETVTSFGRKKRDTSGIESEDVMTTTTLSKSVAVLASEFGVGKPLTDNNYAFPVTAPTPSGSTSDVDGLLANRLGVICFEATTSAVIGGLILFLEIFGFSTCLVFAIRRRKGSSPPKDPICYDNTIENSDFAAPY